MWKLNLKTFSLFIYFLKNLSVSNLLLASSVFLLVVLYPGHNDLQTTIINPGKIRIYVLPSSLGVPYPKNDGTKTPYVSSRSVVVQDAVSKTIMYSKNEDVDVFRLHRVTQKLGISI